MDHEPLDLRPFIRDVPDFPKPGIMFKDITPLLQDPVALRYAVDQLVEFGPGRQMDMVLGAEARGFILGAALAYALGAGFVPARKPGKLPWQITRAEYELEYGTDSLEMHHDAIQPGPARHHPRRPSGHRRHGAGQDRAG